MTRDELYLACTKIEHLDNRLDCQGENPSFEDLKNFVEYQYECYKEGISDRWEYATRQEKAALTRLYKKLQKEA